MSLGSLNDKKKYNQQLDITERLVAILFLNKLNYHQIRISKSLFKFLLYGTLNLYFFYFDFYNGLLSTAIFNKKKGQR